MFKSAYTRARVAGTWRGGSNSFPRLTCPFLRAKKSCCGYKILSPHLGTWNSAGLKTQCVMKHGQNDLTFALCVPALENSPYYNTFIYVQTKGLDPDLVPATCFIVCSDIWALAHPDVPIMFRLYRESQVRQIIHRDLVFLPRNNTMSCLFLSRSFHEREKIEEVSL